jgi:hypothetical protein
VLDSDSLKRLTEALDMLGTGMKYGMSGWLELMGCEKLRNAVKVL